MKRFVIAAVLLLGTAATGSAQDIPLSKILVENAGWQEVVALKPLKVERKITFLEAEANGKILIYEGHVSTVLGPDGKVVESGPPLGGAVETYGNMVTTRAGATYRCDTKTRTLHVEPPAKKLSKIPTELSLQKVEFDGLVPSCLVLWPDEAQLVIGDAGGKYLWTARVEKDGKLGSLNPYYLLRVQSGTEASRVRALVIDAGNLLYAASPLGVQVFDPTGRLCGVIAAPAHEEMTAITVGGKDADTLFVACGDKIYSRKIQGKAVYTLKKDK